jgi:glycosyltransferase involved in cell wall biosynthesis
MENNRRLQIIAAIPAFNEERTISKMVLLAQKYVDKVVVCDDGSSDMTADIAKVSGALVVCHRNNEGKGAALKSLFDKARELDADVVVTLDGDDQHDPKEIPEFIQLIAKDEADIVIGSRFLKNNMDMPLYRRFGSKILNGLVNSVNKQKITDTQSGFRAYGRKALERMDISALGIGVDSEILIDAVNCNMRIKEIPIGCRYGGVEGSTYHPIGHSMKVIRTILKYISLKRPLLVFGAPGAITISFGLLLLSQVVETYFSTSKFAIGTMLISMIAILLGFFAVFTAIILFAIGSAIQNKKNHELA